MIQANEIRIGNKLLHKAHNVISPIVEITETYLGAELSPDSVFYFGLQEFEPIPLTPELLEKVGFTKSVFNQNKYYKDIESSIANEKVLWIDLENKDIKIRAHSAGMLELIYTNYLHQLQNLFWCLTGEELTFPNDNCKR